MRIFSIIWAQMFLFCSSAMADIASTDYIRKTILRDWGIGLNQPLGTVASEKYLMNMADTANGTNYGSSAAGNVIAKSKVDRILSALSLIRNGVPANSLLTLSQVNQYVAPTDVSQWKRIACSRRSASGISLSDPNSINNATGFVTGTIGPGIYFLISNNKTETTTQNLSNIVVFDHAVGYKIMHNSTWEVFHVFIDTDNAVFQRYNLTNASWSIANYTNVSNIVSGTPAEICIYELK